MVTMIPHQYRSPNSSSKVAIMDEKEEEPVELNQERPYLEERSVSYQDSGAVVDLCAPDIEMEKVTKNRHKLLRRATTLSVHLEENMRDGIEEEGEAIPVIQD